MAKQGQEERQGDEMTDFRKAMDWDKPKYNRSTRVEISKLLSFLTVDTKRPEGDWLGKCTGWTKILGANGLEITGACVGGSEYLSTIKYGKNLHNPYNNYVNPFYLFEIFTDEGKRFFIDMYMGDIDKAIREAREVAETSVQRADDLESFWRSMGVEKGGGK